jgi:NAD(P)H-hydrate repair Nnr-like enzyme with NAD(P)H-hydrate epimerase domain
MPDQDYPAPQLRSWTRQGIDVSQLMAAALAAVAAAAEAQASAVAAKTAADQAIALLGGGGGSGGTSLIYPDSIIGITQVGKNLLVAPGSTYAAQQDAARGILGAVKVGTASTDAAPGTLSATVTALANRVTLLESGTVSGTTKDNINIDTDGRPYWID